MYVACTHEDCGETAEAEAAVNAVTDPATCTEPGGIKYTATVVFDGVTYTDVKTAVIPAAGHSYALTGWSWDDDYTAASATFTCPACGETHTVDAVVTAVTTEATSSTPPRRRSTAGHTPIRSPSRSRKRRLSSPTA